MTAKWISAGLLAFAVGAFAQGTEPYPGQRNHAEPPDGWTCSREATDKAHLCFCKGMKDNHDPMCTKPPADEEEDASEDPTCTVFCHKDHCACTKFCDT